MAKIKKAEDKVPVTEQDVVQEVVEAPKENKEVDKAEAAETETETETTDVQAPVNSNQIETKDDSAETTAKSQDDIPEHVLAYLKHHTEEKAVYFDKLGGVFSEDTTEVFLKDAVLYQNPFYK